MSDCIRISKEMLEFIEKSPTSFHAVNNVEKMLKGAGYEELCEKKQWNIERGGKYYVIRNDSSIVAFCIPNEGALEQNVAGDSGLEGGFAERHSPEDSIPEKSAENSLFQESIAKGSVLEKSFPDRAISCNRNICGFHIVAAHSDSPCFKVKEAPEIAVEDKYLKLNTEKYGGMILSTWMDRALSVAGRIVVRDGEKMATRLVNVEKDLLVIPNMAIHMNRDINKGVEYNPQVDMLPLYAGIGKGQEKPSLLEEVAECARVDAADILGQDLFLYVREKGRILGNSGEFVLSPRLDDLQCVYAAVQALLNSTPQNYINMCAIFDNEEVGSGTRQGADSTFLEDTMVRISESMQVSRGTYLQWVADSFLISADNAHAVHPNQPQKADPTNRPYLNGGVVIKYHGGQKYTTDAVSAARMKLYCERAGVPCQAYANRSDILGGSTLGNISTAHVSVSSVDIGLPQLAMHSAVETAGMQDTEYAIKALKVFWSE
ncbi:MAG: M18 family aminopeptidase [Lachnospiraceae bacterium]|nr:M18 family aminopeptidase [Lachnospiraceae bacterium]